MNSDNSTPMCNAAPFGMKCKYDNDVCSICAAHKLSQALNELYQSIPIIGRFIEPYHCPDFTPVMKDKVEIGDPVFFVFADHVLEDGWYISEEQIFDVSVRGIYVKAYDDPEDEKVSFFPYGDESTFFSREEAEVVLQQRIKEYKESERNGKNV